MKTKLFFLTIFCLMASGSLSAQNSATGNISATSTNCTSVPSSCVWESPLPPNANISTVAITGTFTATLLVEESNNGGQTWATAATLSAAGTTTYNTNGFTDIRVRCSAYTSGTAVVTISTGLNTGLIGPPGPAGSGGGISSVSSLPGTCTPGVTAPAQLNVAPFGVYSCGPNANSWSIMGNYYNTIDISVAPYGAPKANLCSNGNLSITTGSNVVTCNNYTFTSADIGKIAWVSCCGAAGGPVKTSSLAYITQGVINSVNGNTASICTTTGTCTTPINATSNASCQLTANGGCQFYFGLDATTAVQAAIAAAYGTVGPCPTIFVTGWFIVQPGVSGNAQGFGNTTPTCRYTIGNFNDQGMVIRGIGRNNSGFIFTPTFTAGSYTGTCTGLGTVPSCAFGIQGKSIRDLTISGGEIASTGTHAFAIITTSTDDNFIDFQVCCWGASDNSLIGVQMEGPGAYIENIIEDGAGAIGIVVRNAGLGPFNTINDCFAGDNNGANIGGLTNIANLYIAPSAQVTTTSCYLGQAGAGRSVVGVDTGGFWDSVGDSILGGNSNNNGANIQGTARLTNLRFSLAANLNGIFIGSPGIVSAVNSRFAGTSTACLNVQAGGTYISNGGNTCTGHAPVVAGAVINEAGDANFVPVTAGKLVLSANWGTGAAVGTLSGGDAPIQFTITNGSASTGASPTITYTFPTPYLVAPFSCSATQTGGTNANGTFTPSALSTAGVTFTFSLTPTASSTEIVQITCVTP